MGFGLLDDSPLFVQLQLFERVAQYYILMFYMSERVALICDFRKKMLYLRGYTQI